MRVYFAEFNRAVGDNTRIWVRRLEKAGLMVERVRHLTAVMITRPTAMSWAKFKDIIRSVLQPRRGSVVMTSCRSGHVFLCSNRGNQPGVFQRLS